LFSRKLASGGKTEEKKGGKGGFAVQWFSITVEEGGKPGEKGGGGGRGRTESFLHNYFFTQGPRRGRIERGGGGKVSRHIKGGKQKKKKRAFSTSRLTGAMRGRKGGRSEEKKGKKTARFFSRRRKRERKNKRERTIESPPFQWAPSTRGEKEGTKKKKKRKGELGPFIIRGKRKFEKKKKTNVPPQEKGGGSEGSPSPFSCFRQFGEKRRKKIGTVQLRTSTAGRAGRGRKKAKEGKRHQPRYPTVPLASTPEGGGENQRSPPARLYLGCFSRKKRGGGR